MNFPRNNCVQGQCLPPTFPTSASTMSTLGKYVIWYTSNIYSIFEKLIITVCELVVETELF